MVKNPPAAQEMQETEVRSLGPEDPLEKGMAIHSGIPACKSRGQRSLLGHSPGDHKESGATEHAHGRSIGKAEKGCGCPVYCGEQQRDG